MAILVPAWREADVIAAMLDNAVATLDYDNYLVFVGVYPNDPETIAEVERVRRRSPRVVRVDVGHPGPTCKGDCLNAVLDGVAEHERRHGMAFEGCVLHDSEDVLHPLELRLFNHHLPGRDMVQLPVVSMERGAFDWTAGVYMDEFAEFHAKDLVVRSAMTGGVPSAGVGTCFRRGALKALQGNRPGPFNTGSLTEDYDISMRLAFEGFASTIVHHTAPYRTRRRTLFGLGPHKDVVVRAPVAVRSYFPNTVRTAVRQRARWTLGITLQGWAQLGWTRSAVLNYFLLRDRKALATPLISALAYLILANGLILMLWPGGWPHARIFGDQPWVGALLAFNLFACLVGLAQRLYFTGRLYGWEHAALSLVRVFVGVAVSAAAVVRAAWLFAASSLTGRALGWDKTMHEFPPPAAIERRRRKLGELLAAWGVVEPQHLEAALVAKPLGRPLGRTLLDRGLIDEETLAEALAAQSNLPRAAFDPHLAREAAHLLPAALQRRARAAPLGVRSDGALIVASDGPIPLGLLEEIRQAFGSHGVVQQIARGGELEAALAELPRPLAPPRTTARPPRRRRADRRNAKAAAQ
jgi:adsorption protein B